MIKEKGFPKPSPFGTTTRRGIQKILFFFAKLYNYLQFTKKKQDVFYATDSSAGMSDIEFTLPGVSLAHTAFHLVDKLVVLDAPVGSYEQLFWRL